MTRPTSHTDLDAYTRKGHFVARIPSEYITRYPSLGQHLLAALAEADRLGLEVEDDEITIPLTDDELDRKLEREQDYWDRGKLMHEEYLEDGVWPTYQSLWNAYLRAEGIPVPTKDEAAK